LPSPSDVPEDVHRRDRTQQLAIIDLRDRCSAGDALYVAPALNSSEPPLTTDARLAHAAEGAGARLITPGDGSSVA